MNKEWLGKIIERFPFISDISSFKKCGNIICLSCNVQNSANYFIVYPDGHIIYKQFDDWEYTSAFNKNGTGNSLVFLDLTTQEIILTYYFKDDLNFNYPIEFGISSDSFVVVEHEERTHIIYLDNFSIQSFGGTEYKIYSSYLLFLPYSGYSSYDTFSLVDLTSKKRVDLNEKLASIIVNDTYKNEIGYFHEESIFIDTTVKSLVYHRWGKFRITEKVFKIDIDSLLSDNFSYQESEIKNPKNSPNPSFELFGTWDRGFYLDLHSISSIMNTDGSFTTERSHIGQLLYDLKYRFKRENIEHLADIISNKFDNNIKSCLDKPIDVIIPISPSNLDRPFQPVIELSKVISRLLCISVDVNYLSKTSTPAIKEIDNTEQRNEILNRAFSVSSKRYQGKTILLFDDLYRSGATLNAAVKVLKEQGEVESVYVLAITKTRTKR